MYYNLLVAGDLSAWKKQKSTYSYNYDRVFEYTSDECTKIIQNNKNHPLYYPCLFVHEHSPGEAQEFYIGKIIRRESGDRSPHRIDYEYCDVKKSADEFWNNETLQRELHIDKFERSRTHWAFKSVDLLGTLFSNESPTFSPEEQRKIRDFFDDDGLPESSGAQNQNLEYRIRIEERADSVITNIESFRNANSISPIGHNGPPDESLKEVSDNIEEAISAAKTIKKQVQSATPTKPEKEIAFLADFREKLKAIKEIFRDFAAISGYLYVIVESLGRLLEIVSKFFI